MTDANDELRRESAPRTLAESDADPDPLRQFGAWFEAAVAAGVPEPTAMTLATAGRDGRPSARMVLLKGYDARGFVFYTNHESRKALEIAENPWASLVFFWQPLERQVRVEGAVARVSEEEADVYFRSRPRGSQVGAWASSQSRVIDGREGLERRVLELEAEYAGREIPRPPFWGGYRLSPSAVEFWQGRASRLHDRLRYGRLDDGSWRVERLSP